MRSLVGVELNFATQSEIAAARAKANEAFKSWRETPVHERLRVLQSFSQHLREHETELINLLVEDVAKPIRYARGEVDRAIALIAALDQQIILEQDQLPEATGCRRVPLGVIALIAPFNNPLAIPIGKLVPALLYGNAVIWKPAIPGSRIAQRTAEIFARIGDSGLLQVVCGDEATACEAMTVCDAVTISGSIVAGLKAQEICAQRGVPLQAELGGNNAAIIWRDADLPKAARQVAEGAFVFAGQRCTANRRVIVHAEIYDAFLDEVIQATELLVVGDPKDEKTHLGPLISTASAHRVRNVIERARATASRVITSSASGDESWIAPTIICCDDPQAEVVQEETFGPVLVVQRAGDWEEAITLCNGVRQGLVAALFTQSRERIEDFLRSAKCGLLKINSST
ncbi:MAG: aldehyde dehydrogenase family protein, partial [Chthoniobacterales bacterium]